MAVKGRLTRNGDFLLANGVDSRLPQVTDNLVVSYPCDGVIDGIYNNNNETVRPDTWVIGTGGSQTNFARNGLDAQNNIIEATDPFGLRTAIWEGTARGVSSSDAGWNSLPFSIDNTKTYRISVWMKRVVTGTSGRMYLGVRGYDASNANIGVLNTSNGAVNTNPYFMYPNFDEYDGNPMNEDEWYLYVGHVMPVGYNYTNGQHPDSGVWNRNGDKVRSSNNDFIFQATNANLVHRTYLYYSADTVPVQYWAWPRAENIDDGYAPTLEDLLNGNDTIIHPQVSTGTITDDGVSHDPISTNVMNNGGNLEVNPTYAVPGSYQPGWNTDMHPEAIMVNDSSWADGYNSGVANQTEVYHAQWVYQPFSEQGSTDVALFYRNQVGQFGHPVTWMGCRYTFSPPALGLQVGDRLSLSFDVMVDYLGNGPRSGFYHKNISTGTYNFGDSTTVEREWNDKYVWKRKGKSWVIDSDTDLTAYIHAYIYGYDAVVRGRFWLRNFNIEVNKYPTAFFVGTRASETYSQLSNPEYPMDEGTVSVRLTVADYVYSDSAYLDIFDTRLGAATNRHIILRKSATGNKIDWMYIRDGSTTRYHIITTEYDVNEEVEFTFAWKNGEGYSLYINGVVVKTAASYTTPDLGTPDNYLLRQGAKLHHLHQWNRRLTDDEVKMIANKGASLKSDGTLRVGGRLETKPITEASGAIYFPLMENGNDVNNVVKPTATDGMYTDEGFFSTDAYTNRAVDTFRQRWTNAGSYKDVSGEMERLHPDSIMTGTEVTSAGSIGHTVGATAPWAPTTPYSLSLWVWVDAPLNTQTFYVREYDPVNTGGVSKGWLADENGNINLKDLPQKRWVRLSIDNITPGGTATYTAISYYLTDLGDKVFCTMPCIVDKIDAKPFVSGSVNKSRCEYNLYRDYGIEWNKPWTICYWKKPTASYNNTRSSYNLECFGFNGETTFDYVGKGPSDTLVITGNGFATNSTFNASDYWNQWIFCSIKYDGTNTMTVRYWLPDGVERVGTKVYAIPTASHWTSTIRDLDFQLGSWSDVYYGSSYYRDLFILKVELTDDELDEIRKTSLRINKNSGITIKKGIISGEVL